MISAFLYSLMDTVDFYVEFCRTMEGVIEEWDAKQLFAALVHYRTNGTHDIATLAYDVRALYTLLVYAMNEQIADEDPGWFRDHPDASTTARLQGLDLEDGEDGAQAADPAPAPEGPRDPSKGLHAAGIV